MSERGSFRGGGRGRGGGYDRSGGRGAHRGGGAGGGAHQQQQQEKPKKENILDLNKYMDKEVRVKFNGGREGKIHPYCCNLYTLLLIFVSSYWYAQGIRPTYESGPGRCQGIHAR